MTKDGCGRNIHLNRFLNQWDRCYRHNSNSVSILMVSPFGWLKKESQKSKDNWSKRKDNNDI